MSVTGGGEAKSQRELNRKFKTDGVGRLQVRRRGTRKPHNGGGSGMGKLCDCFVLQDDEERARGKEGEGGGKFVFVCVGGDGG